MWGINQMLTPHIQDWDMYPFLPVQMWSLSCWGSLAADLNPFWCCVPASDSWRIVLEPHWKSTVWKMWRLYSEDPKSIILKLLNLSHFITLLFSWMCSKSALRGFPLTQSKGEETVHLLCLHAGNNPVLKCSSRTRRRSFLWQSSLSLLLDSPLTTHSFCLENTECYWCAKSKPSQERGLS